MATTVPLKKRRGRPPKYLMVWQQQHAEQQQRAAPGDDSASTSPHALSSERPSQRPVSIINPLPRTTDHQTDVNNNVVTDPAHEPPSKRRSSRGSSSCTKRPRPSPLSSHSGGGAANDFSLRRFFEAGGRDYNEYLEWMTSLKTNKNAPALAAEPQSTTPQKPFSWPQPVTSPAYATFPGPGLAVPSSPAVALTPPLPSTDGVSCPKPASCPSDDEALDLSAKRVRRPECDPLRPNDEQKENFSLPHRCLQNVNSWDVNQVVDFVSSVPGCQTYAQVFRDQQIDGASLPHLSEEHLLNCVHMKLGPAIRLRLAIHHLLTST